MVSAPLQRPGFIPLPFLRVPGPSSPSASVSVRAAGSLMGRSFAEEGEESEGPAGTGTLEVTGCAPVAQREEDLLLWKELVALCVQPTAPVLYFFAPDDGWGVVMPPFWDAR